MKKATRAPAYALIYHGLAEIARRHGYALAIHGSVLTDLDLIAIPWTDDAADIWTLKKDIQSHVGECRVNLDEESMEHDAPVEKPHGRLAWKFFMDASGSVDLSVMPRNGKPKTISVEPTKKMIDAGAQRLVSWDDDCVWPSSWSQLQVSAARNDAERVWRSMLSESYSPDN